MEKLIFDNEICIGCKNCEMICSLIHLADSIGNASRMKNYPLIDGILFASTFCQQCSPAPCQKKCEAEALTKDEETGVVHLDKDKCQKCYLCIDACPFGGISIPSPEDFPIKCELCDGDPKCVKFCPTHALRYGEEEQQLTKRQKNMAVRLKKTYVPGVKQ